MRSTCGPQKQTQQQQQTQQQTSMVKASFFTKRVIMTSFLLALFRSHSLRTSAFLSYPSRAIAPSLNIRLFSTAEREALEQSIATKGNEIRDMKAGGISKEDLAPHVAQLLDLQASLEKIDSPNGAASSSEVKKGNQKEKNTKQEKKEEEPSINELRSSRLAKVTSMREAGAEPYAYTYDRSHTASELLSLYESKLEPGEEDETNSIAFRGEEGREVKVAGRIMMRRVFGKLAFYALQDESGMVQLQFDKKRLGEKDGDSFKVRWKFSQFDIPS
jgi:hypothetical protein